MNMDDKQKPPDLLDQAERWLMRMLEPNHSKAEHDAFEQWLGSSDAHAEAYRHAEKVWAMGDEAVQGDPELMAAAQRALRPTRGHRWRGRIIPKLAVAAILVLAVLAMPAWFIWSGAPKGSNYVTGVGQQRTITLEDGSSVVLDTNSSVRVYYSNALRRVDLLRGRAQFSVEHDARRPFVVHAEGGTVTDIGTVFQVRLSDHKVDVILLHGRAKVATHDQQAILQTGQRVEFDRVGVMGSLQPANIELARGWTQGRLFVHGRRLSQLLTEMDRYSKTQITIGEPSLRNVRVSGVFRTGDQQTLLRALQQGWPIRAVHVEPNRFVLYRK